MSADIGPSTIWDVFHADSLELERAVTTDQVRAALASGALRDDDLVRPAGAVAAWTRLADQPEILVSAPPIETAPPIESAPPIEAAPPIESASPPLVPGPNEDDGGDFEVEARTLDDPSGPMPSVREGPEWLELGGDSDDVAFPVLKNGGPPEAAPGPSPGAAPPEAASHNAPEWILPSQDDGEAPPIEDGGPIEDGWPSDEDEDDPPSDEEVLYLGTPERADRPAAAPGSPALDAAGHGARGAFAAPSASHVALPVARSRDWDDRAPGEADEEEDDDDFSLARSGPSTIEELDLAPMVDVAFQLVLFFMVTATTVLFKTLEIPKPSADPPPDAVAQGQSRSLDDFQEDYVLVEIDAAGAIKVDHEPIAASLEALIERLRVAREKTGRKTMLVSADFTTAHKHAVLAYDAANEIGMGIAIAKPAPPRGAGPGLLGGRPKAPRGP